MTAKFEQMIDQKIQTFSTEQTQPCLRKINSYVLKSKIGKPNHGPNEPTSTLNTGIIEQLSSSKSDQIQMTLALFKIPNGFYG